MHKSDFWNYVFNYFYVKIFLQTASEIHDLQRSFTDDLKLKVFTDHLKQFAE